MRANGFLVFVPKYGVKGAIYLRDRNGNLKLPRNVLSLVPSAYSSSMEVQNFEFDEFKQEIILFVANAPGSTGKKKKA